MLGVPLISPKSRGPK